MPSIVDDRVDGLAVYRHRGGAALSGASAAASGEGSGDAVRVVFVHGSMDRGASFVKVARRLPELAITRYDRRGYGRSVSAGVAPTLAAQIDDLMAVVDGQPSVVVAHSLGGVIALAAASAHPELIVSVGAFESPMSWLDWWPKASAGGRAMAVVDEVGPEEAAERFMRGMLGDERWEQLPDRTRRERRSEGPALVAELAAIRSAPAYEPATLARPVLAGYGSESKPYHQEAAARLAEWAPRGELMVIDGSGHAAQSSHPDAFAQFVRRAVARV